MVKSFQDTIYFKIKASEFLFVLLLKTKNPRNNLIIPTIKYKYSMKYLFLSKRSSALIGIGIVAISIGLISKKLINYSAGGCLKGTQELTYNN